ncbi:MAG: SRPBCC family protein [Pseudomonadota bacterium]
MTRAISIHSSVLIEAPEEAVWRVCAEEFGHIDRWDANVRHSRSDEDADAKTFGRTCAMYSGGETVERIISLDRDSRAFSYQIVKGLPGFVACATNRWTIEQPSLRGAVELEMRLDMELTGLIGFFMQVPVRAQMSKLLR